MRLSNLTYMASTMKPTSLTSRNRKRKTKRSGTARLNAGRLLQNQVKPPEWNSTISNHAYGLTRDELKRRRELRISKNLTTAQVELYHRLRPGRQHTRDNTPRTQSLSPNARLGEERMNQDITGDAPDLNVLLRRSQDLINESRELLRHSVPVQKYCTGLTRADSKSLEGLDSIFLGDMNQVEQISEEQIQVSDSVADTEASSLAQFFDGLTVAEDKFQ